MTESNELNVLFGIYGGFKYNYILLPDDTECSLSLILLDRYPNSTLIFDIDFWSNYLLR